MSRHQLNREATLIAEARARRLGAGALDVAARLPDGHPARKTLCSFSDALALALRLARAERPATPIPTAAQEPAP